jgi:hypothetical protein
MTVDYILYEMTYANLVLFQSVIPNSDNSEKKDVIKADDPANREKVRQILFGK